MEDTNNLEHDIPNEPVATEVLTAEVRYVEPQLVLGRQETDTAVVGLPEDEVVVPPPLLHSASSMTFGVLPTQEEEKQKTSLFFNFMADHPWPFLVTLPCIFLVLLILGWGKDDIIEERVSSLWIPEEGQLAKDRAYADQYGMDDFGATSFAAMALSRDGKNILTADRLEEVRARMEMAESITITHNGNVYNWDDLCGETVDPYRFPCVRLSPMDLYKEAEWTFTTEQKLVYYEDQIQDLLIAPRLPRFGIMTDACALECSDLIAYRTTPNTTGYNPVLLLADIDSLEYNDPCRICIEDKYPATIKALHGSIAENFGYLQQAVNRTRDSTTDAEKKSTLSDISDKLGLLMRTVTADDVVEFHSYYTARGLYGELGANSYISFYEFAAEAISACYAIGGFLYLTCPPKPENVTKEVATKALLDHADNTFSSVTTAGAPYPFWSEPDGTGVLFVPNEETGRLMPVSGSGVNMSAPIDSMRTYFGHLFLQESAEVDPDSREWKDWVEANPLYAWFMASVTPADPETRCGNGNLTGTDTGAAEIDVQSTELLADVTPRWCTEFDVPGISDEGSGTYTKLHFARMWYDLLFVTESLLDFKKGVDNPYSWTIGVGCGYDFRGERFSYTNQSDASILYNSSRLLYNLDEGSSFGVVDPNLLIGGTKPAIGEYSYDNPLKEAMVLQSLYFATDAPTLKKRLMNCNRPGGTIEITDAEAGEILYKWKESMENAWTKGWDDEDDGEVQFVSFFDDAGGAVGSTGRMLNAITLDNNTLMAISIVIIAVFSGLFLYSTDMIESRVLIALIGVAIVVLSFFAAVGFSILLGIKINVNIAWTLPFVIIGLGVDDVYIVLIAIKKQGGYTKRHWLKAMREVIVPVTMTSLTNASMFAILNLSDIPAVYLTSQVACYGIIFLYVSVILCFPAFCFLDLKRQQAGRMDMLVCLKSSTPPPAAGRKMDVRNVLLYDRFYKPIILSSSASTRKVVHLVVFLISFALFGVASWGVSQREVGLGLEEFFPSDNPSLQWAKVRTSELASWPMNINWGDIDYTNPTNQMKMIKQFEGVVTSEYVAPIDTKYLWMAHLQIWSSRHCNSNFDRPEFDTLLCGRDQVFPGDNSTCSASWIPNELGLREKTFSDVTNQTCRVFERGICRPLDRMHPDDVTEFVVQSEPATSFCPVIDDWSDEKWQFCLGRWRNLTNRAYPFVFSNDTATEKECSGEFYKDETLQWPIPYSRGPAIFSTNLVSHQTTLDMIAQTQGVCDEDEEVRCWVSGIPFNYWSQYEGIFSVLLELSGYAVLAGFVIATTFLFAKLSFEKHHTRSQILFGSLAGAGLIAVTMIMTLVTVVGFSVLAGVNVTGFSNMSFVLSVGFAVEYSVHIVSRWMRATMSLKTSLQRVHHTMSFLMLPTFMSFVSSTIGVVCLAFTDFEFNKQFFFRPLMIVMIMSYWFGCWFLPVLLIYVDFDFVKLGKPALTMGQLKRTPSTLAPIAEIETTRNIEQPRKDRFTQAPPPLQQDTNKSSDSSAPSSPQISDSPSTRSASDSAAEQWDTERRASRPDPPDAWA